MTQEQKELLLKDLCARLPYDVKISVNDNVESLQGINILDNVVEYGSCLSSDIEKIKPYLFPFSNIYENEELMKEFDGLIELELKAISDEITHTQATEFEVDFYNKHHLDWRGLIPMGLAIDATGLNIY